MIYLVQVWHGNKYRTVWKGSNLQRAITMSKKSYYTKYYTSIKIVRVEEILIDIAKYPKRK